MDASPSRIGKLIADKAYDTDANRARLSTAGVDTVIPGQRRGSRPLPAYDKASYQARHLVENTIVDLKQFRGIATRYCKLAATYLALVLLVAVVVNTRATRRGASPHT